MLQERHGFDGQRSGLSSQTVFHPVFANGLGGRDSRRHRATGAPPASGRVLSDQPRGPRNRGSSSKKRLCEEILALTKLDRNSAVFAQKEPITTAFSSDVEQILSEVKPAVQPKTLYRFYM